APFAPAPPPRGGGGTVRHYPESPPRRLVPARVWRHFPPPDPGGSKCRAAARRHRPLRSPPAALGQADTSSRSGPRTGPLATPPSPTLRLPRSSFHPHPLLPH